jgi:hypothetical protein
MRRVLIALALFASAGCGSDEPSREQQIRDVFANESAPSGPSSAQDIEQLEAWSGKTISLVGRFEHLRFTHGVLVLKSGLRVYLPHFDQFMEGEDWFKYVGQKCWAYGILHTYTKDIDGYRGPSLELSDFSGP